MPVTQPGQPSPMFQTVREVNADASVWGDELLAGGFGFAGALLILLYPLNDKKQQEVTETLLKRRSEQATIPA